jgi:predicted nucleic acid-binding protein
MVVDASALLEALLHTSTGEAVERRLARPGERLRAPHLIDVEITQALRRKVARGEVSESRGRVALESLAFFPIRRYPHGPLLSRVWELRNNLTAYDAMYVALAEALDAPLLTRDQRLAAAAGHHARIELV